jgi:hypothetical protein
MVGLAFYFFELLFLGVIWGTIHAWNQKVSFALFIALAITGLVLQLFIVTSGGGTSADFVQIFVGVLGFAVGHQGGRAGYNNTFGD